MEMVIRGIKKAFPQPDEKNLMNALFDVTGRPGSIASLPESHLMTN